MKPSLHIYLLSLLLLFSLLIPQTHARHISGGYMTYECLGGSNGINQYEITLHIFRDCKFPSQFPTNTPFDKVIEVRIFDGATNNFIRDEQLNLGDSTFLSLQPYNNCSADPIDLCYVKAEYRKVIELADNPNGYHLAWARCCRTEIINNLENPDETGLVISGFIPTTSMCNSSPYFAIELPLVICDGTTVTVNIGAIEPDGDSIAYEIYHPTTAGSRIDPFPIPLPPPYAMATFLPSFNAGNPFGSSLNIDPLTGEMQMTPTALGLYAFAVTVKEYRNGQLISEVPREILMHVIASTTSNEEEELRSTDVQTYPNPFSHSTMFAFSVDQPSHVSLELFDTQGRKVATLMDEYAQQGKHQIEWTPQNLARGLYYCRIGLDGHWTTNTLLYNHP